MVDDGAAPAFAQRRLKQVRQRMPIARRLMVGASCKAGQSSIDEVESANRLSYPVVKFGEKTPESPFW